MRVRNEEIAVQLYKGIQCKASPEAWDCGVVLAVIIKSKRCFLDNDFFLENGLNTRLIACPPRCPSTMLTYGTTDCVYITSNASPI